MFFSKGIRNAIRYYKISIFLWLFSLLIVIIMSSSFQVHQLLSSFLQLCDKTYTTVGVFEYLGANYPNENIYDSYIPSALNELELTLNKNQNEYQTFYPTASILGHIDGLDRSDKNSFCSINCIAEIYVMSDANAQNNSYTCIIKNELYSKNDHTNNLCYVNSQGIPLEKGHNYLVHGMFYLGNTSYTYFSVAPCEHSLAIKNGFPTELNQMVVELDSISSEEKDTIYKQFQNLADTYKITKNSVKIIATANLDCLPPFQTKATYITNGQNFIESNYQNKDNVCIISEVLAKQLNVTLNDTIPLSKTKPRNYAFNESYWAQTGFESTENYTVVGLFDGDDSHYYDVYIPEDIEGLSKYGHYSYTLGECIFHNETAAKTMVHLEEILPKYIRLTTYDGGYTIVSKPIKEMLTTVTLICLLASITCLAFLSLFGYLYVYKQRKTVQIMSHLGSENKNIYISFLSGSGIISLSSVVPGSLIGFYTTEVIMNYILQKLNTTQNNSIIYSNSNLSPIQRMTFSNHISYLFFIGAALIIYLLTLLSCIAFTKLSLQPKMKKISQSKHKDTIRSTSLAGGSLKYSWLSVKRGGIRSMLPFIITFVCILLILQLQGTLKNYKDQLSSLDNEYECSGHITNFYGNDTFGVIANASDYNLLLESNMLKNVHIQSSGKYAYFGIQPIENLGQEYKLIPSDPFALETFKNHMLSGPDLFFTDDISSCSEFYNRSAPNITYMEGMDEAKFYDVNLEDRCYDCIVSSDFKEMNHLDYGQMFLAFCDPDYLIPLYLKVVGTYEKTSTNDNIYVPIAHYLNWFRSPDQCSLDSIIFTLNAKDLERFKNYIKELGYDQPNVLGAMRKYIVIEDANYYSIKNGLEQKISYMRVLFPILCILLEFLAYTVAFVLIKARSHEITILRLLGVSRKRCFLNLYYEQLIFTGIASLLSMIIFRGIYHNDCIAGVIMSIGFFLLWNLGCVLGILKYLRKPVIYTQKDTI